MMIWYHGLGRVPETCRFCRGREVGGSSCLVRRKLRRGVFA